MKTKKFLLLFLAVFLLTAIFFSGEIDKKENYFAQASLWDVIRAWVTINPLDVNIEALSEVEVNKVFQVKAEITNKGGEKIENVRGEIILPEGLVLLRENPVQEIGVIPPKKIKKISWSVKGEKEGNYVISVLASGELKEQLVQAEDSTLVKVKIYFRGRNFWQWLKRIFFFRD